jgi:acyl dehydratase
MNAAGATMLGDPFTEEQIRAMPTYSWDAARVGDTCAPFTYGVTPESIAAYCEAVRNRNPLYLDPEAAREGPFGGIIAPPTFAFMCAPLRRNEVMHTRGFAAPEEKGEYQTPYAKSELKTYRPISAGESVYSFVYLAEKYERRGNRFMTWKVKAVNGRQMPAFDYTYTIIWPDGPSAGEGGSGPASPSQPLPEIAPEDALPTVTKMESQEAIDRYSVLTRVRPRIGTNLHQDAEFARRTIFGGTANTGVATAAYCAELLEQAYGPGALLKPGARIEFKGIRPIRAGDEITLTGRVTAHQGRTHDCEVWVHAQDGGLRGVATATVVP